MESLRITVITPYVYHITYTKISNINIKKRYMRLLKLLAQGFKRINLSAEVVEFPCNIEFYAK